MGNTTSGNNQGFDLKFLTFPRSIVFTIFIKEPKMFTLIGGSPSTGSSLLVNILNRHPDIFAGPETYLFTHQKLYENWKKYKSKLLGSGKIFGLKSPGWFLKNGVDLLHSDFGWVKPEMEKLIAESIDFEHFIRRYFAKPIQNKGARQWIEKTPSNAYLFETFLEKFPKGKVIHTVRNPYDTVVSLVARGYDAYYAAGAYVCNTSFAMRSEKKENYFRLSYEDLVLKSEVSLRLLFEFLELPFSHGILEVGVTVETPPIKMEGWQQDEKGSIRKGSIGRFAELSGEKREEIITALSAFQISARFQKKYQLPIKNCRQLCQALGYEFLEEEGVNVSIFRRLQRFRQQDILRRTLRLYPTHLFHYPGRLVRGVRE